jgi:hypothetical protein
MTLKRVLQTLALAAVFFALTVSAVAQSPQAVHQINFDNVIDGTLVNNSYSGLGVTFDCHLGSDSTMNACTGTNSTGYGGHVYARTPTAFGVSTTCNPGWIANPALAESSPNVVSIYTLTPCPGNSTFFNEQNGYIVARFPTPAASVSIFANAVFPPESLGTTTNMPYMNAYDVTGKFLKTVQYSTSPIGSSLGWVQLNITAAMVNNVPIGLVVFSSSFASGSSIKVWGEFDSFSFSFPATTVPNVVGMTLTNADAAIAAAKLVVGTVTHSPSSTVPAGNVISQNPAGGTMVSPGTAVNLVVSCGPPATVPNVLGKTQTNAQTAITAAKLAVGTVTKGPSSTVPAGNVASQTPHGGTVLCPGSKVNLTVSCGLPTTVPNVVHLPVTTAKTDITNAHLVVGTITTAHSSTVPAGDVISQSPKGGTVVCRGTAVSGVVSLGP